MADPFLEQLKRICREKPVRTKWVLVPNQSLRWTLGERLLHESCDWVNLRLVTPLHLATEAAAPGLLEQGINPCPETLGPSLLQNLLLSLKSSRPYFRDFILQPGMAEALWRTLGEFRLAGLTSQDLSRLPKGNKRDELTRLFSAFEVYLSENRLADRAMLLRHDPPIQPDDLILIYPYHAWAPLELSWLSRLPGQRVRPEAALSLEAGLTGWWEREPRAVEPGARQFFSAVRRCDEIEEILRRVLAEQVAFDQVEIAALPEDFGLVGDRLAAHGLGCTFESGLPILTTRPGQLLDGLITWLEHGLTAYHLRDLLDSNLLRAKPDGFTALKLLESAQISWGRDTYHPQLDALAVLTRKRLERDANQPDYLTKMLEDISALKAWLRQLFQRLPPPDSQGHIQPNLWFQGLQETLCQDFQPDSAAEGQARQTLLQVLEELKMLPQSGWQSGRLLALLRQRLRGQRALASRPRPGLLHVCSPESLGLSGRSRGFWIGLEEGRLLKLAPQDCILSDRERQRLHPGLLLSSQRSAQTLFHWRERLASYSGLLTLSYAQRDSTGEQEQMPSWIFLELLRGQDPSVDSYEELDQRLGPAACTPARVCRELFPSLVRGAEAERIRQEDGFTSFDGYVPAAAGLWDPRISGAPISVSRLKALATCPFQVFLENGLGLQKPPPALPESDAWLDAAHRGTVLHEVYAAYQRHLRSRSWTPNADRDKPYLVKLLDEQLELVRKTLPPPNGALEKAERNSLKKELEHYLRLEIQFGRRPIGLEVPFGMGPDAHESLAHPEPVWLELGEARLPLRGRIDRIDQLDNGYAVLDYKTGRELYTGKRNAIYDRGRLLQHAIYALVVEKMLQAPGRVMQSSYYFPTTAAARPWSHFGYPNRADFQRVIELVLAPLQSGVFVHSHQREKDCRFCDYSAACESHRDENCARKLEAHALLEQRRQLLEET